LEKYFTTINVFEDVTAKPIRIHFPVFDLSATAVLAPALLSALLNTASPGSASEVTLGNASLLISARSSTDVIGTIPVSSSVGS
jgi:hypothetical protein